MKITSRQDISIKDTAKLKMKKYRDQDQKILVEGYYPILFAYQNNYPLENLYICTDLFRSKFENNSLLEKLTPRGVAIREITENVFEKISCSKSPEGLLAIAPQRHMSIAQHNPIKDGFYVVVESIEKPGNLGEIFRLADSAGASGVIVCDVRADIFDPKVIRNSLGTFFSLNILEGSTPEAIAWCKSHGIKSLATTPQANTFYTEVDMKGPLAIIVGAEYAGLSASWMQKADVQIKIPMFGQAKSLSVTASTAIVLYEALRQRAAG